MILLFRRGWLPVLVLACFITAAPPARGQNGADAVQALVQKADALGEKAKYQEAVKIYEQALELARKVYGPEDVKSADITLNLANQYLRMGQFTKAESAYERILKLYKAKLAPDDPKVALVLNNLAIAYWNMGQFAKIEPLHKQALTIRESKLGPNHPDVAATLNNLAYLYIHLGQFAKAEPLFERSLKILEAAHGPNHPSLALSLQGLAGVHIALGRSEKAEGFFRRALKIQEDMYGPDHPAVAAALYNLGYLYYKKSEYARAEPLLQRSLKIREAALDPDHPDVSLSAMGLAVVYRNLGQFDKTEALYVRTQKRFETKLGPDHPHVTGNLHNLILLYSAQKHWPEAVEAMERQRRGVRRHVARILPVLSESEQLTYLQNSDEIQFHMAQALGLGQKDEVDIVARSAGWVLNGKAVAQQALAERALLARENKDPVLAPLVEEVQNVRRQLAALSLAAFKSEQAEERKRQMTGLAEREQDLSKKLGQRGGHTTGGDPWIELETVRKALPTDAVLIEISKFNVVSFEAKGDDKKWLGDRYAAWLIFPVEQASRERKRPEFGPVRLIDLGEAGKIEDAIKAVRLELQKAQSRDVKKNPILLNGEEEAEEALRQLMIPLAKLVLEPLLEHIGGKKQWIISPDAALWLVPWAALPLKDVKYAVEKYQISYVISGRDLVTPPAKVKPGQSIVMADPDYDLGLADARAAVRKLLNRPESVAELRGITSSSALPIVERLKGTAGEAAAIEPKLARYAGAEPKLYTDRDALEAVFKSLKSPKVLVLSTHGFFLEDQEVAERAHSALRSEDSASRLNGAAKSALLTKDGKLFENPLVRCGLLLAGCNDREGGRTDNDEDGVLTGLEIVGTDLRGTELVVLSACETGLGQVRNGEGVAGLRQAFQLAGAQAVVATLWSVRDRDTELLMSKFFENLAAGKSKADALREAQLARIKARRVRNAAAHPFFWAAFTLTGQ